jgi:tetratricopeptide (TPR) repeat protein
VSWGSLATVVAALSVACGDRASPAQVADVAAAEGRWADAFVALEGAGAEPRILGRRAEAAFRSGRLSAATREWERLARFDTTRRGEAAVGIARAAAAAERQRDAIALSRAVIALRTVAPEWPVGRLALGLRMPSGAPHADAPVLVPAILAAAPARDVADDALYALGRAAQERDGCRDAAPIFHVVVRRATATLAEHATRALAGCRVQEGVLALAAGDTVAAIEAWDQAVELDPAGEAGRRALLGLGDVHFGRGDIFAAQLAWQAVATMSVDPDSITALALERLRARPAADSTGAADQP